MKRNQSISILKQGAILLSASLMMSALTGCSQELTSDLSHIDTLRTSNDEESGKTLKSGVTQTVDVDGENFKLVFYFLSGENEWHINANKKLYMEIKTKNLPDNLLVYIDNIHCDTSIVSTKAPFDGIKQDTMDDHIHNSLMYGFPIDDTHTYFGVNEIDGQNESFIEGFGYGNQYYTTSSIEQKRYLESDFLSCGVYANKIDTVVDLIIVDKLTNKPIRTVSVPTSLLVEINDKITFQEGSYLVTYDYERDGSRKEIKKVKKED